MVSGCLSASSRSRGLGSARENAAAASRITQKQKHGPVNLSGITVIAMDEFAIQKGHLTRRHGQRGAREEIRPFFELLGPEGCARLRAAVMDMNTLIKVRPMASGMTTTSAGVGASHARSMGIYRSRGPI